MKCEICGKDDIKNLGVHLYHAHQKGQIPKPETIKVDNITEKPLSLLISEIKALLRPYQHDISTRISEVNGAVKEIDIMARIQVKEKTDDRKR